MFSIGSSAMMMQILFAVQQTFLFKQAFFYGGEDWGILMSATMRLYMFSFIPLWGMSQGLQPAIGDRKSTRLNSSHANISYAVFCLQQKLSLHPYHSSSRYI